MTPSLAFGPDVVAIPGPSVVPDRVLTAMHRPMPDIYDGELVGVVQDVYERLPVLARTTSRVFITISNGHGAWAMALANTLSRGDLVLVLECGRFGTVWAEMAAFDGLRTEVLAAPVGFAVEPDAVAARLAADGEREIKAVLMVQTDTASSVRNDVRAIRAVLDATDHPALLMVDAIASLGCECFEMDEWGVDVTVSASQKGLMTPPGLGFVWAGPRARAAHASAGLRTQYWDWSFRSEEGPIYYRFCGTPPVSHLFGLREALTMIDEEGLTDRWARHAVLAGAVRAAVEAWSRPEGIELHARRPEQRGNSVTAIGTGTIDAAALTAICRDELGVTLGLGLGALEGRGFRIAHMGHVSPSMLLGVLGVVETALHRLGEDVPSSGVAAATQALTDPDPRPLGS